MLNADGKRRQTIGNIVCGVKREDTRPLKDVRWKREKAQFLLEFMKEHGVVHTIEMKALCSCPSNSEVSSTLQFLFNLVDHESQIDTLDGDMVLTIFKKVLKYPFNIPVAKKVIQITPLTWHTMFGAIIWLAEKLKADEERLHTDRCGTEGSDGPKEFYMWVDRMYEKAQLGLDDWRRIELDVMQNMERQVRDFMLQSTALQSEMKRLGAWLHDIQSQPDDLLHLQQQWDTFRKDLQNFTIFVAKMQEHNVAKAAAIAEEERTAAELSREVAAREQDKALVLHALHSQEISKDEEEVLKRKKALFHAQLADQSSRLKSVVSDMQEVEHQLHRKVDQLNVKITEVNGAAALLHCCPGGKHPYPGDVLLRINAESQGTNIQDVQPLQPDPKDLRQAFDQLRQRYQQKQQVSTERLCVLKHELKQLEETRQEQVALAEAMAAEVAHLERSSTELADKLRSCEKLRVEMDTNMVKYNREFEQLTAAISAGVSNLIRFREIIEPTIANVFVECDARLRA
eukprot:GGOE01036492.1.p1 GENE.GGOE01036492.1~~GGOE01036492.1.p1  ORF type:complete len:549 (-),score=126.59 GGOE01036492.1:255-1796(-)